MMQKFKTALAERLMGRLWIQCRTGIEEAVVPGSGGIAFLGDSLTHLARLDILFPGMPTRNFGIGGECAEHLLKRLTPIISLKPSKVFLFIGSNDLSRGFTIEQIGINIAKIFDELSGALPECKMYLQTVIPRRKNFTERIKALNAVYAEIAADRKIQIIDLYPLFDDGTGKIRPEITNDDLHLLGKGYSIWRQALMPFVMES